MGVRRRRRLNDGDEADVRTALVLARLERVTARLEQAAEAMEERLDGEDDEA